MLFQTLSLYFQTFSGVDELDKAQILWGLKTKSLSIYAMIRDDIVAGFAITKNNFLEYLAVDPRYRKEGIGGTIMKGLISLFSRHYRRLCLECTKELVPFYSRYGAVVLRGGKKYNNRPDLYLPLTIPLST